MSEITVLSWNTAKRLKRAKEHVAFLSKQGADILALQEVIPSTECIYRSALAESHPYQLSSFELARDKSLLVKKRMFGQLLLSKYPLEAQDPEMVAIPWPERLLSAQVNLRKQRFLIHTTHIPPGSSNGWVKVDMIGGIVRHLIEKRLEQPQILCGDFNTPKYEHPSVGLLTFAQHLNKAGEVVTKKTFRGGVGVHWDAAERSLFDELQMKGFSEVYRVINPDDYEAYSWSFNRAGKEFKSRFDHIFASSEFGLNSCQYLSIPRELSDHKPITAELALK